MCEQTKVSICQKPLSTKGFHYRWEYFGNDTTYTCICKKRRAKFPFDIKTYQQCHTVYHQPIAPSPPWLGVTAEQKNCKQTDINRIIPTLIFRVGVTGKAWARSELCTMIKLQKQVKILNFHNFYIYKVRNEHIWLSFTQRQRWWWAWLMLDLSTT